MAKKKRKKRPAPKPGPQPERQQSSRAERKEQARIERERRIKAIRRKRLLKRLGIAALVLAIIIGGVFFFWNRSQQAKERRERASEIAAAIGCQPVDEDVQDEGAGHVTEIPTYQSVPATSGPHFAQTLPGDVSVYDQPADPVFEARAVHNLEHGYVMMYYRSEGDDALAGDAVSGLEELAESEEEVIIAPYPNLPEGENLTFVAWTNIQRCNAEGEADDVMTVAEAFIQDFKNSGDAPEAGVS